MIHLPTYPEDLPRVANYSGGASSEWMVEAVIQGVIPRPRRFLVVVADPGAEHAWTYKAMDEVEGRCRAAGIEFARCYPTTRIEADLLQIQTKTRADHPPFFIDKGSAGKGQSMQKCTAYYKLAPLRRAVSAWLKAQGLRKRVVRWIGFGSDEYKRVRDMLQRKAATKTDRAKWELPDFPAVRYGRSRAQQREELVKWTGRAPRWSACIFCPWNDVERWQQTPTDALERVYAVDEAIRDAECVGLTDGPAYLTDRLIPIRQLVERGDPQPTLPGLENYCVNGACFL